MIFFSEAKKRRIAHTKSNVDEILIRAAIFIAQRIRAQCEVPQGNESFVQFCSYQEQHLHTAVVAFVSLVCISPFYFSCHFHLATHLCFGENLCHRTHTECP